MKYIDLFAGVGGFHFAMKKHGDCVFASEYDQYARKTYKANHPGSYIFENDITKVIPSDIPAFDILCAGFPCQPFSLAGKREGFLHKTQGNLFFNIMDIVKYHQPEVVFLENVKNLESHDNGNTFKVILELLEKEGYFIRYSVLNNMKHANIPQNRDRIFIIGFKDKEKSLKFEFPIQIPLTKSINDILESNVEEKYFQTNMESPSVKKMVETINEYNTIYQYRRYYVRANKKGVCPTLTANMGTGGHNVPLLLDNGRVRKLTPRECFRLQGYEDSFIMPSSNSHLYKQAGNTVCVPLVSKIADNIIKVL